jgi:exodeoxyribonuclease-3
MRVITLNVNGLRSAIKKGLFDWLLEQQAQVICMQETRLQASLPHLNFELPGYEGYFCHAYQKGYSGVAIYTQHSPKCIIKQIGWELADQEGRYIQLDWEHLSIASIYFPSGSHSSIRQQHKFEFLEYYQLHLEQYLQDERQYILCGDWNIAHRPIDIKNWRANQKHSGFLPEERAWLDRVFGSLGYIDAFRALENGPDHYTWWSNRGRAWEKNVGWRIDYQVITPNLKDSLISASIYKGARFSDHAPLIIDYDIILT